MIRDVTLCNVSCKLSRNLSRCWDLFLNKEVMLASQQSWDFKLNKEVLLASQQSWLLKNVFQQIIMKSTGRTCFSTSCNASCNKKVA